jgi:hypothetical protein
MRLLYCACAIVAAGLAAVAAVGGAEGRVDVGTVQVQIVPAAPAAEKAKAAWLGATTSPATETLAQQLKLAKGTGLVVGAIEPHSAAASAGLRTHDVLVKLDDQLLTTPDHLAVLVATKKPGDKVDLTILREGTSEKVAVTLGEKPADAAGPDNAAAPLLVPGGAQGMAQIQVLHNGAVVMGGGGRSTSVATRSDGEHTLTLTTTDGDRRLVAKDAAGKTLFDGPVNTEEERKAVPPEIAPKLQAMVQQRGPRMGNLGQMVGRLPNVRGLVARGRSAARR